MKFGDNASDANDFETAKKLYGRIVELDSLNKDALYKLGVAELNLKDDGSACEHMYKSFMQKNAIVSTHIRQYCQEYPDFLVYPLGEVDEKPRFIYGGETFPLFKGKDLSPKFRNLLIKEMRNSEVLFRRQGTVYTRFQIDKKGNYIGDILQLSDKEISQDVKREIFKIFDRFNFLPAMHKGKTAMISEVFMLPLGLGN